MIFHLFNKKGKLISFEYFFSDKQPAESASSDHTFKTHVTMTSKEAIIPFSSLFPAYINEPHVPCFRHTLALLSLRRRIWTKHKLGVEETYRKPKTQRFIRQNQRIFQLWLLLLPPYFLLLQPSFLIVLSQSLLLLLQDTIFNLYHSPLHQHSEARN